LNTFSSPNPNLVTSNNSTANTPLQSSITIPISSVNLNQVNNKNQNNTSSSPPVTQQTLFSNSSQN
jgi:hypothetical protein